MEQPSRFVHPQYPDQVCLLKKSLYGLKQAPRAWYHKLIDFLIKMGFVTSQADHSLFFFHKDYTLMFVLVYLDDIIIIENSKASLQWFCDHFSKVFPILGL